MRFGNLKYRFMSRQGLKGLIAAVIIMMCLGSIYSWSIYVPYFMTNYGYSNVQTQLIFGSFIGIFSLSMVLGRRLLYKYGPKLTGTSAALVYASGYFLAYFSYADFYLIFIGISVLSGIATGFGYLISISIPVEWFPQKKGFVMGLVSAGFGGGAILESLISQTLFNNGFDLLTIFLIVGITKGFLIFIASFFIKRPVNSRQEALISFNKLIKDRRFLRLFIGMYSGTFAGLLIIGNLKHIGMQYPIDLDVLVLGITVFSVANFSGRLFWGWLNDLVAGRILIPVTLVLVGMASLGIGFITLNGFLYLFFSFVIGFIYGASFVIYANETAQIYGLYNLGRIYPFVFLGYGISGVMGPFTGGLMHDIFGNYGYSALVSAILCFVVLIGWFISGRKL